MKFTAGFWSLRNNVTGHFPTCVYESEKTKDKLTVYAPTRIQLNRGCTVSCPLLEISLSSPLPDVLRIRIEHHKGLVERNPGFFIHDEHPAVTLNEDEESLSLQTGDLKAVILKKGDWSLEFSAADKPLTGSGYRNIGYMEVKGVSGMPDRVFMKEELALGIGEYIYGLGERFTPFVKNGQVVEIWNEDGGTSSEIAYKNIPFYLSSNGYGILVNHPEKVAFEVASEKVMRAGFSVPGEFLEYFVIYGPEPKRVLENYTLLTGRPALPPAWTFGLWLSTSFVTDYDEQTVTNFIQGMADRDLPLQVFHFDCFWMKAFHWSDFDWDSRVFPDPRGMLRRLKARGLKICVWINPYIAQRSSLFREGVAEGYFLKKPNGDVFQWDLWQAGMALIDFTNPEACKWFAGKLARLVEMGVDCFKTDFGERIPLDVVYTDGADPLKMHNFYPYLYNKTVFGLLEQKLGKGQAVVFARSAAVGSQQFPVHWGGDNTGTYESMAESLRGGLSLTLSGFGFWSHDIGGFESTASPDVYKRWIAFGLLSSHSRLHGSGSYRVPWLYDEEAVAVLRHFTKLKLRLMPYIFAKACEAHFRGIPAMRAMLLEFPDDFSCLPLDRQYMLGEALLVAPVFSKTGQVDYYLPAGRWTHFLTGRVVEGSRWVREIHDFLSLPLLARPNSVIPVGQEENRPDYDYAQGVVYHVFELAGGASLQANVPGPDGSIQAVMQISRQEETITISPRQGSQDWAVLLRGINAVRTVENGTFQQVELGVQVIPGKLNQPVVVRL